MCHTKTVLRLKTRQHVVLFHKRLFRKYTKVEFKESGFHVHK